MATPSTRTPIRLARGTYSNLNNSIADLQEGEIVYATDQNNLYVKEGSSLILVTTGLLDEDNMATNSATHAASQQSIKAYVDASSTSVADDSLAEVKLDISNTPSDGYFLQYKDSSDQLTWAVPTDTNTTYSVVDSSANGLAPQLPGSHGGKFLKADGSWEVPPDTNTQVAIDDTPVNGVTSEAISSNWAYDHNAATGNSAHVPAAGSSGEFLAHDGDWATPADATKMPLAGGTFTGSVTFEDAINENVFAITDASSPVLEPNNGMLQTWTLNTGSISGSRTPSDSIAAGQSMLLMVDDGDGSDAITWPSTTWVGGSAPTLATSGYTVIELWKVASTLYAAHVGNVA